VIKLKNPSSTGKHIIIRYFGLFAKKIFPVLTGERGTSKERWIKEYLGHFSLLSAFCFFFICLKRSSTNTVKCRGKPTFGLKKRGKTAKF
jgi:hypothetical protein